MNNLARFIFPTLLIAVFLISPTIPTAKAQQLTTLYVDPPSTVVVVSTQFTVTVNVAEVTDLYGWEFNMTFNPALLECKGVTEGPFLKKTGKTTFFIIGEIDNVAGKIRVGCLITDPPPGVDGSGILAEVTFHCKAVGNSALEFNPPDLLVDSGMNEIPHESIGGSVTQYVQRPVGGVLVPVNKLSILAPYLALIGLVGAVATVIGLRRKREA